MLDMAAGLKRTAKYSHGKRGKTFEFCTQYSRLTKSRCRCRFWG